MSLAVALQDNADSDIENCKVCECFFSQRGKKIYASFVESILWGSFMRLRGLLTFVFGDMGYVIILIVYPNKWHGQLYVTKHYISTQVISQIVNKGMHEVVEYECDLWMLRRWSKQKNLMKFSQLSHTNFKTVKSHFATYSQNLTHTLQRIVDSPSFYGILFSWPNI